MVCKTNYPYAKEKFEDAGNNKTWNEKGQTIH
jgi:hypothetical protein